MQENKKALKTAIGQIRSLTRKLAGDHAEETLEVLTETRDRLLSMCHDGGITTQATEECPPADPDCEEPSNP